VTDNAAAESFEPGSAIGVIEGIPRRHLGAIRFRVVVVGVCELPPQSLRQSAADEGLAGAGHPHDDHDARV
jgi:hypothetical protein